MLTVIANAPGQPAPSCSKVAAEQLCVWIDFTTLMREHELLERVAQLDPDGAMIEKTRCNQGLFVQLDLGPDTVPAGQPHLDRLITFCVKTTQGSVSGALAVRVFP